MNRFQWGLLISGIFHGAIFAATGAFTISLPTVSVATGETHVRIVFQESTPPLPKEPLEPAPIELVSVEKTEDQRPKTEDPKETLQIIPVIETEGVDYTEADYVTNPPPLYPRLAILRNLQGRVVVWVQISATGDPLEVKVNESSGYEILNKAAVESVWKWKFSPARLGRMAMKSEVKIPIHFKIVERKQ